MQFLSDLCHSRAYLNHGNFLTKEGANSHYKLTRKMKGVEIEKKLKILSNDIGATVLKISNNGSSVFCAKSLEYVLIYDLVKGEEVKRIKGRRGQFYHALELTSKDTLFAYGCKKINVLDTDNWKKQHSLKGNAQGAKAIRFSADEKLLAVGGGDYYTPNDFDVKVFDLSTDQQKIKLKGHQTIVEDIAFDASKIYTIDVDCVCKTWDANTGAELQSVQAEKAVLEKINSDFAGQSRISANHVAISAKEHIAVAAIREKGAFYSKVMLLFDIQTGAVLHQYKVNKLRTVTQLKYHEGRLWIAGKEGFEIWEIGASEFQYISHPNVITFDIARNSDLLIFCNETALFELRI